MTDRIGGYTLLALAGRGGFGEVWRARDERLGRHVALKLLADADSDDVKRFLREAQTAAGLDHPNIAPVYEAGFADGRHFIAMAFVNGAPPRGPLAPRDAARIVRDAARALAFAHDRGIIHRDLKPSNILVEPAGHAWVVDFGLARQTRAAISLTASGMLVGTPAYMSPEQALGERATPASDVYSLGATLHELVSGRAPFEGDSLVELLTRIVEDAPPAPPRAPRELAAIVLKCLEKDPRHRYASASRLAEDLDRFLAGRPVEARPPGALRRATRFVARHRGAVLALVLALAATAAGAAVLLLGAAGAERRIARRAELRRLDDAIAGAQPLFYIEDADIGAGLAAVERAVVALEAVEPKDAEIWTMIGTGRRMIGDFESADAALQRAIALDPARASPRLELARLCFECAVIARWGEREDPEQDRLRRSAAWVARADGLLARVPDDATTDPVAHAVLRAYRAMGDPAGLAAACDDGLRAFGDRPGIEDLHVLVCVAGKEPDVDARLATAFRVRPHYPLGLHSRTMLRLRRHELREALADTDAVLVMHPRSSRALRMRSQVQLALGDIPAAVATQREAVRIAPGDAHAWNFLGLALWTAKDAEGALQAYDESLRLDPLGAGVRVNRGRAYLHAGRLDDARADFERAAELAPHLAEPLVGLAVVAHRRRDYAASAGFYRRAIAIWPGDVSLRVDLATALARSGALDDALTELEEAVRQDPEHANAWYNRGLVREMKRDAAGAIADYDRAIGIDPAHYGARLNRGGLRREAGDAAGARTDFDAAVRIAPERFEAYGARAQLLLSQGDARAAADDIRRTLKLAPSDWSARAGFQRVLDEIDR